jgi:glycosyltransferase involved in cell wall biosynthesis
MMLMRQVLPNARLIGFNEPYYRDSGGDVGFDPEFPSDLHKARRMQVRNLHLLSRLLECDVAITPTYWQASCFPLWLQSRLRIVHDGIQTDRLTPNPQATFTLPEGNLSCRMGDELITFVNRNLEPMRGYHQFMRALPQILRERPRAHVVIVGGDNVSYGARPAGAKSYKQLYLQEVQNELDMGRLHFVNRLPYSILMNLLRVSAVHVYLTVPFVLSWSMLEAMSLGAMVVGSDTAPVREVIKDGLNGKLVDFFEPRQLAETVCDV